jgi:hypothetical protein
MIVIPESKKNHVWRKVVWHTDPEDAPLGPHHSAEVYCSEEANGFAVWYVRKLGSNPAIGVPGFENGDYLLSFHARSARDAAIERAVLLANRGKTAAETVTALDQLAAASQKV